jgi:shikimate kinase
MDETSLPTNIVLIGFTSTGKSTTGRALAEAIRYRFRDLDDDVEALHLAQKGKPLRCRDIVSLFGRECFVEYESQAIDRLRNMYETVLSTGGGAPLSHDNREKLMALGTVVYVRSIPEVIFERMRAKGTPVYMLSNPTLENLSEHWRRRDPVYQATADIVVDNSQLSVADVVDTILKRIQTNHDPP